MREGRRQVDAEFAPSWFALQLSSLYSQEYLACQSVGRVSMKFGVFEYIYFFLGFRYQLSKYVCECWWRKWTGEERNSVSSSFRVCFSLLPVLCLECAHFIPWKSLFLVWHAIVCCNCRELVRVKKHRCQRCRWLAFNALGPQQI